MFADELLNLREQNGKGGTPIELDKVLTRGEGSAGEGTTLRPDEIKYNAVMISIVSSTNNEIDIYLKTITHGDLQV